METEGEKVLKSHVAVMYHFHYLVSILLHVAQCILISVNEPEPVLAQLHTPPHIEVLGLIVDWGLAVSVAWVQLLASFKELPTNNSYDVIMLSRAGWSKQRGWCLT